MNPKNSEHKQYLQKLCADFESSLKKQIHQGIMERSKDVVRDPVYSEVIQHAQFCRAKSQNFYGREDLVDVGTPLLTNKVTKCYI